MAEIKEAAKKAAPKKTDKEKEPTTAEQPAKTTGEEKDLVTEAPQTKKKDDPYESLANEYARHYPDNKVFHITTDKQVFLEGDRNLAALHQSGLDDGQQIHSVKVK